MKIKTMKIILYIIALIIIISSVFASTKYWQGNNINFSIGNLFIDNNGNIGIGTTEPKSKLDILGGLSIDGNLIISKTHPNVPRNNTITIADSVGLGGHTSITIGIDGLPIISYYNAVSYTLNVLKCGNSACSSDNSISTINSGSAFRYTSIAIGANGFPVISYVNFTGNPNHLKFAKCHNIDCSSSSTTIVDNTINVSTKTSVTIGTDALPIISYYDATNGNLKVAKCGNSDCSSGNTITTVDGTATSVGRFPSITIGVDGLPIISYYDYSNSRVKVIKCSNSACSGTNTISIIATGIPVEVNTCITTAKDGLPIISYGTGLRIAKCNNINCSSSSTTTLYAGSGSYSSIAIGTDGLAIMSYISPSFDLHVGKCGNEACTVYHNITIIDDESAVAGNYNSIAIGNDGLPIISYYDFTNNKLKIAKCGSINCQPFWTRR